MSGKSEYDQGVNTFSPEGRIKQIEYAMKAANLGATSVGIQTAEGVLLAAEKRLPSKLVDPKHLNRVFEIDSHLACVMSGLTTDARILIETARVEATNHRFSFNEPMRVEACSLAVSDSCLRFGERKGATISRPFGVSLLIAGVDDCGPQLWHTDPSGLYVRYNAKAIGRGEEAQTTLQDKYHKSMTLEEAEQMAVGILKQVMEDPISKDNVEVATIRTDTKALDVYSPERIEAIIKQLP